MHYTPKCTKHKLIMVWFGLWCLTSTFNNISVISWWSVLLVEETGVPGENNRPIASHWQTLSHNVLSSTPCHERDSNTTLVVIGTDDTGSCKSNYLMITTTTTTTPKLIMVCIIYQCVLYTDNYGIIYMW